MVHVVTTAPLHPHPAPKVDTFEVTCTHVGALQHATVYHNSTTPGAGWYLDFLEVTDPMPGGSETKRSSRKSDGSIKRGNKPEATTYFPCFRWLDKGKHDGSIRCVLQPSSQRHAFTTYRVVVTTGDLRNASTEASVFVRIVG